VLFTLFKDQTATGDGTLYNNGGVFTVTQSVFARNIASGDGAGIFNTQTSANTSRVERSLFVTNNAVGNGGAIANSQSISITNSTFDGNFADNGGAIANLNGGSNAAELILVNSTLVNNEGVNDGGAVYNESAGILARAEFYNVTMQNNIAKFGAGIFNRETPTGTAEIHLANSINHNPGNSPDCENNGGTISTNSHNLDRDGSCAANINDNPSLGGGREATNFPLPAGYNLFALPPQAVSVVLSEGSDALCQGALVGGVDQLGNPRDPGSCDLGAVEVCDAAAPVAVMPMPSLAGADVVLNWVDDPDNESYEVWLGTAPYFGVGSAGAVKLADVDGDTYTDVGGATNGTHYYLIRSLNRCGEVVNGLENAGIFHFPITPGS
jgi:hypothetical protein